MDVPRAKHNIIIAQQQAGISQGKHEHYKRTGEDYTAQMYWVRWQALRTYIQHLKDEIKKHERKAFKRANNQ